MSAAAPRRARCSGSSSEGDAIEAAPLRGSLRSDWVRLGQIFAVMALSGLGFYLLAGYSSPTCRPSSG